MRKKAAVTMAILHIKDRACPEALLSSTEKDMGFIP
jgi:hypothetical protein